MFPDGLDPEVRPRAPLEAKHLPVLDKAIEDLKSALEAREKAREALAIARAAEDSAQEVFLRAYDENAGAVRQLFPGDLARQNLYFDTFRSRDPEGQAGELPQAPEPGNP